MNKPQSMTVKEWIVKKMSINMVVPEKTINAVINHQFTSLAEALPDNNTLEITGFGTLQFLRAKALKKYAGYEFIMSSYLKRLEEDLSERKRNTLLVRIASLEKDMNILKPKIHEAE